MNQMMRAGRTRRDLLAGGGVGAVALAVFGLARGGFRAAPAAALPDGSLFAVRHTTDEWRHLLGPARFDVMRRQGTEFPFSSPLDRERRPGTYACAGCRTHVFDAVAKYDSGTGWPSFFRAVQGAVARSADGSLGMERTEIHCATCGSHLGHVFPDGPPPTGLRFCMNGIALLFTPTPA